MKHLTEFEKEALRYHAEPEAGKIAIAPMKPCRTQHELSLAYSPGVGAVARAVADCPDDIYRYTRKGNLVAVISNGTSVLGFGNIGAAAAKPVMEGKALLFKVLANIDAFDIEIDTTDTDEFVAMVKAIAPTFGGINLEDIKAPECFEIEERLQRELQIPVMHDDQHGTAITVAAAVVNSSFLAGKELHELHTVINGAGAASIATARLLVKLGIHRQNITLCDSQGVVTRYRNNLTPQKREFATSRRMASLGEALTDADLFVGLSRADVLTGDMLQSMAANPIVLALANPEPEIAYDTAVAARPDIIFATGRADYPNQVNNVLAFPYVFRGALDARATRITDSMKLAAAHALASLAREEVPTSVLRAYNLDHLEFGREYIIPKPQDPRLRDVVATAVAKAST